MRPPFPTRAESFLWRYIRRRPWLSLAVLVAVIGGAGAAVASQYAMKMLVDALSQPERREPEVWRGLALFLGLIAVENALWRTGGWLGSRAVIAIGVDIRLDLFQYLIGHASRYFVEHPGGALANRLTATATATATVLATLIWNIIPPAADLVGTVVVLVTIEWHIALTLLVTAVFISALLARLGTRGRDYHRAYYDQAAMVGGEIVDVLSNTWIVKAFSGRRREYRRLQRKLGIEALAHLRSWMFVEKMRVLHDVFLWLTAAVILIFSIHRWATGGITTGDVVLVATVSLRILHGSRELALSFIGVGQNMAAVREALRVIGVPHEITEAPGARAFQPAGGTIHFEQVDFAYPGRPPLLRNFNLTVPAGQSVGIVGPSGGGKTTLIRLVQRLDDVTAGHIAIDGQAIHEVTQESLRNAIAVVPQEISLFDRTVLENIRYSRPKASDEEVVAAAVAARCHGFIEALPAGYRTMVGDRGIKLSGGQRQRLGIARAILKGAPIIIFDEATSSLDTKCELEIQLALESLIRERTVLAVAHRLSTIASFDRVLFIENGRIVEDGCPRQIRHGSGPFARLWQLQGEGLEVAQRP